MPNMFVRRELVRGEVRTMAPAGNVHGRVAVNLTVPLGSYVRENDPGLVFAAETGFKIEEDPDTVHAPDVAFLRRERVEEVGEVTGYWPGAPDLTVRVVSPNDLYTELEEKASGWLEAGTRMVLVVNPRNETISIRRPGPDISLLDKDNVLDGGGVVPGWSLPVRDVFE